jgi:xylan 1,4-beta-xylosidase
MRPTALLLLLAASGTAQNVAIRVDAAQSQGAFKPIYNYFGYDEPNYTYTTLGKKLVGELAGVGAPTTYIRTHFMLATGDGTPGFKFGSTNAYTEDASGKPVYDWTITDRIFDTYLQAGAKPFVEVGFMPKALSTKPEPYTPAWTPGGKNDQYSIGWSYPPSDYAKWGNLVSEWVRHAMNKYGRAEVATWYWEVWNEPDIAYWHGSPEDYNKLYDYAAAGLKKVMPEAKIGGPATTGPSVEKAAVFLRQFLQHCATGKNYVTGQTGAPLDFITYHAKGRPLVVAGHVEMGIAKNAQDVDEGYRIVAAFPAFRNLPIVLSESDPEGCAACSARVYPQNAYRNGPLYAAYTATMMKSIFELADREKTNIAGMLTWAFEFEGQPWFDGFRTLATNGVDKPVLNVFRMEGMMRGDRVKVSSAGQIPLDSLMKDGVRGNPDIDAFATRSDRDISVLAWNYHDDDLPAPPAAVTLEVSGIPTGVQRVLVRHFRIDETHSNAWTVWKQMGSPQQPNPEQFKTLEAAGQLQLLDSPRWIEARAGAVKLDTALPRQAVSLIQIGW